jgi:hypothetical protein
MTFSRKAASNLVQHPNPKTTKSKLLEQVIGKTFWVDVFPNYLGLWTSGICCHQADYDDRASVK